MEPSFLLGYIGCLRFRLAVTTRHIFVAASWLFKLLILLGCLHIRYPIFCYGLFFLSGNLILGFGQRRLVSELLLILPRYFLLRNIQVSLFFRGFNRRKFIIIAFLSERFQSRLGLRNISDPKFFICRLHSSSFALRAGRSCGCVVRKLMWLLIVWTYILESLLILVVLIMLGFDVLGNWQWLSQHFNKLT